MRRNSGLTGSLKTISKSNASGKHDTFDAINERYKDTWPVNQWVSVTPTTTSVNRGSTFAFSITGNYDSSEKLYAKIVLSNATTGDLNTAYTNTYVTQFSMTSSLVQLTYMFKPTNTATGDSTMYMTIHAGSPNNAAVATSSTVTINSQSLSVSVPTSVNQSSSLTMTFTTTGAPNGSTIYWYLDGNWNPSSGTTTVTNNSATATATPIPSYGSAGTVSTSGTAYLLSTSLSGTAKSFTGAFVRQYITPEVYLQINGGTSYAYSGSSLSVNEGDSVRVYLTGPAGGTLGMIYNNQVGVNVSTTGFSTSDVTQGTLTTTLDSSNSYSTTYNITNDMAVDGTEYVKWNITSAYDGSTLGNGSRQLLVNDTSVPPAVSMWYPIFEGESYTYNDPSTPSSYTISTTESASFNVKAVFTVSNNNTYDWSIVHGTTVNADFSVTSGTATASSGVLTIPITPVADSSTEYNQTFRILLSYNSTAVTSGLSPIIKLKDTSVGTNAVFMNVANATNGKYTTSGTWNTSYGSDESPYMYYHDTLYNNTPTALFAYRNAYYHDYYYYNGTNLAFSQNAYYFNSLYGYEFNFSRDGAYGVYWNGYNLTSCKYSSAWPTNNWYSGGLGNWTNYISPQYSYDRIAKPHFNSDGTKLYLTYYTSAASPAGWYTDTYNVNTAYAINSMTYVNTWKRACNLYIGYPPGGTAIGVNFTSLYERGHFEFNATGTKVVTMSPTDRWAFKIYTLSTAWDLSTATETGDADLSLVLTGNSPSGYAWRANSWSDFYATFASGIKCFTMNPAGTQLWVMVSDSQSQKHTYRFDIPAEYVVPKLYTGGYDINNMATNWTKYWFLTSSYYDMYSPSIRPSLVAGDTSVVYNTGTYSLTNANRYDTTYMTMPQTNNNGAGASANAVFSRNGLRSIRWDTVNSSSTYSTYYIRIYSHSTAFSATGATELSYLSWVPGQQSFYVSGPGQTVQLSSPMVIWATLNNDGSKALMLLKSADQSQGAGYIVLAEYYLTNGAFYGGSGGGSSLQSYQGPMGNGVLKNYNGSNPSASSITLSENGKKLILSDYYNGQAGIDMYNLQASYSAYNPTFVVRKTLNITPNKAIYNYDGSAVLVTVPYSNMSRDYMYYFPITLTEVPYPTALTDSIFMVPTSTSFGGTSTFGFNASYDAATKLATGLTAMITDYPNSYSWNIIVYENAGLGYFGGKALSQITSATANSAYSLSVGGSAYDVSVDSPIASQLLVQIGAPQSYNLTASPLVAPGASSTPITTNGSTTVTVKCQSTTHSAKLSAFVRSLIKVGDSASYCNFYVYTTSAGVSSGKYIVSNISSIVRTDDTVVFTGTVTYSSVTATNDYIEFPAQYGETYSYVAPPVPASYITVSSYGGYSCGPSGCSPILTFGSTEAKSKFQEVYSALYIGLGANYVPFTFVTQGTIYRYTTGVGYGANVTSYGADAIYANSSWSGSTGYSPSYVYTRPTNTVYFTLTPGNHFDNMSYNYQVNAASGYIRIPFYTIDSNVLTKLLNTVNISDIYVLDNTWGTYWKITNITAVTQYSGNTYDIFGTFTNMGTDYDGFTSFIDIGYKYPMTVAGPVYNILNYSANNGSIYSSSYMDVYFSSPSDTVAFWNSIQTGPTATIKFSTANDTVWTIQIITPPNGMYYSSNGGPYGAGAMRLNFNTQPSPTAPNFTPSTTIQKV